jgi:hypothetical protein
VLGHAGGSDESLGIFMFVAGLWVAWAAVSRIRGVGFARIPLGAAWAGAALSAVVVAGALVVPDRVFPATPTPSSGARPASTASLTIERPSQNATVSGDDLEVVLRLDGGTIVDSTSTTLTPDTGHVHVSLDGEVVSMTYGLVQSVSLRSVAAGTHLLQAEFVAADHGPFEPRVTAVVRFVKEPA